MTKTLLAIRHVAFESLGAFEEPLTEAGYAIDYCDIGVDDLPTSQPDMLVVLGGPIGVYENDIYPFLNDEIRLIATCLAVHKPVLGLCLGAQLMARALGARVYPGHAKEIGWKPLILTAEGESLLAPLKDNPVLHWHGDTFDMPAGAINLARTEICDHQAISIGRHALAFQCHPEVDGEGFERWLIGHSCEIAGTPDLTVPELRADTARYAAATAKAGRTVLKNWLAKLP
jgi:GMP synthase (glutamine-hydrolysing)